MDILINIFLIFILIIFIIIVIIGGSGVGGELLYFIGNPLARLLGLQDAPKPHTPDNKVAKIIELRDECFRVEYQGSYWFAKAKEVNQSFNLNENVIVSDRDGLTLIIAKMINEA